MKYFVFFFIIFISLLFYKFQNKKERIGGKIALCKVLWLDYTLITWFFLPIIFYHYDYKGPIYSVIYSISISMWIRGIIELYMLYGTKNWTPPIGILHNIFTFSLSFYIAIQHQFSILEFLIICSIMISLILETYYAYAFFKIVKDKTKGDKAIWFASKEDSEFKKILRITTFGNMYVYFFLILFLIN